MFAAAQKHHAGTRAPKAGCTKGHKRARKPSMSTVQEIEKAIEALPLADRLRLYRDLPQLIGRDVEDLDWQRLALEQFFRDDSPDDECYDQV